MIDRTVLGARLLAITLAIFLVACGDTPEPPAPAEKVAPAAQPVAARPADQQRATSSFPTVPELAADAITISGVSAGGYMAQQLHLAHSARIDGVALIASGPWGCSDGSLVTAMARCMGSTGPGMDTEALAARATTLQEQGLIDATEGLRGDRVWLFSGTLDNVVAENVVAATVGFYEQWMDAVQIRFVRDIPAAHHFPTLTQGNACDVSQPPFLGACQYDGAGEALTFLLGPLNPPAQNATGTTVELPVPEAAAAGLLETAYLYLPAACVDNDTAACRLHLVLHGCAQSAETLGTAFVDDSGYQRWADSNRLAVLFPQVAASAANPYACWDWWGYTGADYATKKGRQVATVMALVDRLTGAEPPARQP